MKDYLKLGKYWAYILRHKPDELKIKLDDEDFVCMNILISAINKKGVLTDLIKREDINFVVNNDDKGRFEIKNGKMRALYGHSLENEIKMDKVMPPDILYHGTTNKALRLIMSKGLKPMRRQYVHLSKDIDTAIEVGKRREENTVILKIDAKSAFHDGIVFYNANDKIFLCKFISEKYIKLMNNKL